MQHNKFDRNQTPEGHFNRFKEKLEAHQKRGNKKPQSLKWYLVAASLALLVSLWYNFKPHEKVGYQLADVSEEMKETQDYFTSVIQYEIKQVNLKKDTFNSPIIEDALHQITILENEYSNLSKELQKAGFEKRIINAMIFNFQQRIGILEDLTTQLESIKTIQNENNKKV